jgi:hypothetical protein
MEVVAVIVGDEVVAESAGAPKPPAFAVFLFFFLLMKRPFAPLLVVALGSTGTAVLLDSTLTTGAGSVVLLDPTSTTERGITLLPDSTLSGSAMLLDPTSTTERGITLLLDSTLSGSAMLLEPTSTMLTGFLALGSSLATETTESSVAVLFRFSAFSVFSASYVDETTFRSGVALCKGTWQRDISHEKRRTGTVAGSRGTAVHLPVNRTLSRAEHSNDSIVSNEVLRSTLLQSRLTEVHDCSIR